MTGTLEVELVQVSLRTFFAQCTHHCSGSSVAFPGEKLPYMDMLRACDPYAVMYIDGVDGEYNIVNTSDYKAKCTDPVRTLPALSCKDIITRALLMEVECDVAEW
eukprot:2565497-Rhodomonas_salina.2